MRANELAHRQLVQVVRELEQVSLDLPVIHRDKGVRLEKLKLLYYQVAQAPVHPVTYLPKRHRRWTTPKGQSRKQRSPALA